MLLKCPIVQVTVPIKKISSPKFNGAEVEKLQELDSSLTDKENKVRTNAYMF